MTHEQALLLAEFADVGDDGELCDCAVCDAVHAAVTLRARLAALAERCGTRAQEEPALSEDEWPDWFAAELRAILKGDDDA